MKKKNIKSKKHPSKKTFSKKELPIIQVTLSQIRNSMWIYPLILMALLILLFTIRKIANFDIGFHLAAGRWIIENFSIPYKDILTYTVPHHDYIDIQWLFQVLIYTFYLLFDYAGLTVLNSVLILSVFYVIFKRANQYGVHVILSLILILTALITIQIRFSYRPEIITWLFILLILFILDRYYYFNKGKLFWLPLIMIVWVNMHGLFIIGFIIMVSYLISISFEKKKLDRHLFKWTGISFIAVFLNPYFEKGVLFPFHLFTRLQKGGTFKESISELRSPFDFTETLPLEIYLFISFCILSFLFLFITWKKRSLHEFILLSAFLYISVSTFRNIPIFIFYAIQIIAISVWDILREDRFKSLFEKLKAKKKIIAVVFASILILISLRVITNAYYWSYNSGIKFGFGIDDTMLPNQSSEFINMNNMTGRMINKLEFGGWLGWKTRQPVFIDGRLEVIEEDFYKEYNSAFSANGLSILINRYDPEIVINDISTYSWTEQLNKLPGWKLVHWDQTAAVYSKDSLIEFDYMKGLDYAGADTEFSNEEKNEIIQMGYIAGWSDWMKGFFTMRKRPVELIKMGNFSFDNEQLKAAESLYLAYIKKCSGAMDEVNYSDVYYNLGTVYYLLNDYYRCILCYEKYLSLKPFDTTIKNRVNEIKGKI